MPFAIVSLLGLLVLTGIVFGAIPSSAGHLLDRVIVCPGGFAQNCDGDFLPDGEPMPIKLYQARIRSEFHLSEGDVRELREQRPAIVLELLRRLEAMPAARRTPRRPESLKIPKTRNRWLAGPGVNPDALGVIFLEIVTKLDVVESIPQLLRLEAQLDTAIALASQPGSRGILTANFESSRGYYRPWRPRSEPSVAQRQKSGLFDARYTQAELITVLLRLLRAQRYPPLLESPIEQAYRAALVESAKASETLPWNDWTSVDPIHGIRLTGAVAELPLTRELRADVTRFGGALRARSSPRKMAAWIHFLSGLAVLVLGLGDRVAAAGLASTPTAKGHQFRRIPAGTWHVGERGHRLNPARVVRLRPFLLAEVETTNAQFAAFVRATGYVTDAEKLGFGMVFHEGLPDWKWLETPGAHWRQPHGASGPTAAECPQHPVTQISGADAEAYCRWLGGRLPTLDEWEVAARAGARGRWPWGEAFEPGRANIWNGATHLAEAPGDGFVLAAPVRSFPPNAWGFHDMIGNVFEYCAGLPGPLRGAEATLIAARGGSWWCSQKTCNFFNLVDIGRMDRRGSLSNQGFRVAFDPPSAKRAAPRRR